MIPLPEKNQSRWLRRKLAMVNDIQGSVFRDAGGVMAYAVGFQEVAARTASFIDRILKGATPGDLPIEQPTQIARMGL